MTLVVAVVALVVAIASYLTWTAGRLDRLGARVEAAWASLDAQLVRRAAAAAELAAHARRHGTLDETLAKALEDAALVARDAAPSDRGAAENELTRRVRAALAGARLTGKGPRRARR